MVCVGRGWQVAGPRRLAIFQGEGEGGAHLCYEKETSQKPERTDGGGRLSAR